jgi:hypothetical protein
MLYYIQAEITLRVWGISGPFGRHMAKLVQANSPQEAKTKFEDHARRHFSNMQPESMEFNYTVFADTI